MLSLRFVTAVPRLAGLVFALSAGGALADRYSTEVLSDSPAVYYTLDEGSGTTASDLTPNALHGAIVNAVFTTGGQGRSGKPGDTALFFDGSGDRVLAVNSNPANGPVVNVNAFDALALANRATVEFWAYETVGTNSRVFSNESGERFSAHGPWGDRNIYFDSGGCCAASQRLQQYVGNGLFNRWSHWVYLKDGNRKEIYRDGQLLTSTTGATAPIDSDVGVNNDTLDVFAFGGLPNGAETYGGRMDDLAVYPTALTSARIMAHFEAGILDARNDTGTTNEGTVSTRLESGTLVKSFDRASDLDFTGTFPYAVNAGAAGGFSIGNANFTDTAAPGVTVTAVNTIPVWLVPDFGSTPDDNNLEILLTSIRWSPNPSTVNISLANLVVGNTYKLQLFALDRGDNRGFDVFIEGKLVVDDFNPGGAVGTPDRIASVIIHSFVATDTTLDVVYNGANTPFADKNPILDGFTLEAIPDAELNLLTNDSGLGISVAGADSTSAAGATVVVNPDGTFSYNPATSSILEALGQNETITDTFTYTIIDGPAPAALGGVTSQLELWLDATDIDANGLPDAVSPGTVIANWQDKSGMNRDFDDVIGDARYVASSTHRQPAVNFNGNDALRMNAGHNPRTFIDGNGEYTLITVARYSGNDRERVIAARTGHNWLFGFHGDSINRWHYDGWGSLDVGGAIQNNLDWHLHTNLMNVFGDAVNPAGDFYLDGRLLTNDGRGTGDAFVNNVPDGLSLGAWSGLGEASTAEVSEVIMYNRVLSELERQAVEEYLNVKYFGAGHDTATVTFTVTGFNDTPVANDDGYVTGEDSPISVAAGLSLLQLDSLASGDYSVTADGETFEARVDHDGTNGWLLIGRGRNGWLFDNNPATGQQSPGNVNDNLRTPGAFAPAHYRDNIVIDLLNAAGVNMSNVEIRLLRAGNNTGTGDYQEVIWSNFTGKGGVFSWDLDDNQYGVTAEYVNAPPFLPGAQTGTFVGKDTRDSQSGGNDGSRIFTWPWGGHNNEQGFSYGQAVTTGANNGTSYFWEFVDEQHPLPYTEVYLRITAGSTSFPAVFLNDTDAEVTGGNSNQVLEIVSAGPLTGAENVLPDTEALPNDNPAHLDSITFTSALGGTVTLFDDGSFDYDPTLVMQGLNAGDTAVDSFVYTATDNDPVSPLTDTATVSILVNGVNDQPTITPPGIPDTTIFTSAPQGTLALFPAFADVDNTDPQLTYTVTGNTNPALIQPQSVDSADGLLVLDTPCTLRGSAVLTVRATDPGGLWVADTFTVTVTDDVPPVLAAKDIILNVPAGMSALADFSGVTALDKVDGPLPVTCTPDDSAPFPVGVYVINCQATDLSGNTGMTSFRLFVLEIAVTPGMPAIPAPVAVTGSPAPGAGGPSGLPAAAVLSNPTRLYLNDAGDAAFEASLLGVPAANNAAVFSVLGGMTTPLAVKGVGGVSSFNHLSLAPDGDTSFRSDTGADFLVRSLDGGGADSPGLFPRATTQTLYQHAKAGGTDDPVVPGIFRNGVAGVTTFDDTFLSTPALLVQEGDAAPAVPGATYGQIKPRAVAGSSGMLAFACSLRGVPLSAAEAVLAGPLAGPFALVAREGDTVPDTGGAVFGGFSAESINGAGRLALKASLRTGGAVTASNNDVLLTNRNGFLELLAREGSPAPCIATPGVVFGSFREVFMGDDGSVVFLAFLTGAVGSGNDGTLWRSDASGAIHLLAREGEAANNTEGIYQQLLDASASASGRAAFRARLIPGLGDATTANALGLWAENPVVAVPQLVARQGDTFELAPGDTRTLTNITFDATASAQGGSGGYGRVLGDGGHVAARLSLSGNASGAFILDIQP